MRYWFGASWADWTFNAGNQGVVVLSSAVTVTFWNLQLGGVRYTDLLDAEGQATDAVVSGNGADLPLGLLPRFQGPPDVLGFWADAGAGSRFWMTTTDLGEALNTLTHRVAQLELQLATDQTENP